MFGCKWEFQIASRSPRLVKAEAPQFLGEDLDAPLYPPYSRNILGGCLGSLAHLLHRSEVPSLPQALQGLP